MSVRHRKYRCEEKRPAATVDESQHSVNPVMLTQTAHYPKNTPDESRTGRSTFNEDFLLEHSRPGQQSDSEGFAGCF
jgi:hypothetical protein